METTMTTQAAASPAAANRRWWALAVVVAAQFMFVVDAFIVNVALPSIRRDIAAGPGEMAAVIAIYQVAYAAAVITGGRLGDIWGRKRVFIAGVVLFTAASLWCGLARSGPELVLARLAQGGTAALMVPQVLATIHPLFPDAARAQAFAVFGVALGLGGAVGFVLGGSLVTLDPGGLGWRSVFLVNLPVGLLIALAAWRVLPAAARRPGTRLDLAGAAILFASLVGLIGPVLAGPELGWPAWAWGVMAAGAAGLVLFGRFEREVERGGGMPLIDLALLEDRAFGRGLASAFAFQLGNVPFYLLMTLFMQNQIGLSPAQSGTVFAPLALAFTLASQLAGRWSARRGPVPVLLAGCAAQFAGIAVLGAMAATVAPVPMAVLVAALVVFGFGQGLVMAPLAGLVLATVKPAHAGSGAGLLNTVQQGAGALGVSLVGAIYLWGGGADRRGVLAAFALLGYLAIVTGALLARMRRA